MAENYNSLDNFFLCPMESIRIKNIGPIIDTGLIPLTHIMVVIGEQSSGKSTFMKVLCYCRWLEKKVMIGDYNNLESFKNDDFLVPLKTFHKLNDSYFCDSSSIEYRGEAITIYYHGSKKIRIEHTDQFDKVRHNTKLSYQPAERNLLSVVSGLDAKYRSSTFDVMFNSVIEFNEANAIFNEKKPLKLSIVEGMEYFHEGYSDYVRFNRHHDPMLLEYMSSGVQATVPISIMSSYLTEITGTPSKRTPQSVSGDFSSDFGFDFAIDRLGYYNYPQLFVEEPEQHLFPQAQANLIEEILVNLQKAYQKTNQKGYVFITTHSPYVLVVINLFLMAGKLKGFEHLRNEVDRITSVSILPEELSIYSTEKGRFISLKDAETGMIGANYLDSISVVLSAKFDALYDLYAKELNNK